MRWGSEDIAELRARLTSNTVLLTAFISTSQVRVGRRLEKLAKEFKEGKHEGSIISTVTVDSLAQDEKEIWRNIRKEFENIGISVAAFDANKGFILDWFRSAIENGSFEEINPALIDSDSSPDPVVHDPSNPVGRMAGYQKQKQPGKKESYSSFVSETLTYRTRRPRAVGLLSWLFRYDRSLLNAFYNGDIHETRRLIEKGADVDAIVDHRTLLGHAAYLNQIEMVKLLLDQGADASKHDTYGRAALHLIYYDQNPDQSKFSLEIITTLLATGANINDISVHRGATPLFYAVEAGDISAAKLLLENGADAERYLPNKPENAPLHEAVLKEQNAIAHLLLEHGANADAEIDVNLRRRFSEFAVQKGRNKLVQNLLDHGASYNAQSIAGFSMLNIALYFGYDLTAALFLKEQASVEPHVLSPYARRYIRRELTVGLPDDENIPYGQTHLHIAVRRSCSISIKLLLQRGAKINAPDKWDLVPLDYAVRGADLTIARSLIERGATDNFKNWSSYTRVTKNTVHENLQAEAYQEAIRGYRRLIKEPLPLNDLGLTGAIDFIKRNLDALEVVNV